MTEARKAELKNKQEARARQLIMNKCIRFFHTATFTMVN